MIATTKTGDFHPRESGMHLSSNPNQVKTISSSMNLASTTPVSSSTIVNPSSQEPLKSFLQEPIGSLASITNPTRPTFSELFTLPPPNRQIPTKPFDPCMRSNEAHNPNAGNPKISISRTFNSPPQIDPFQSSFSVPPQAYGAHNTITPSPSRKLQEVPPQASHSIPSTASAAHSPKNSKIHFLQ